MRKYDLTGKVFGKLTVAGLSDRKKHRVFLWECKCECGNTIYVHTQALIEESRKSCGCEKNIIGLRTGRLTVLAEAGIRKYDDRHSEKRWLCMCDCGNTTELPTAVLTRGKVKTCGCAHRVVGNKNPRWKGYGEISGVMWKQIRACASSRKLDFTVTIEQLWDLFLKQGRRCALTSIPIEFGDSRSRQSVTTASLDRIDSARGYVLDNVQWVHKDVNKMKTDFSQDYFLSLCKQVAHKD